VDRQHAADPRRAGPRARSGRKLRRVAVVQGSRSRGRDDERGRGGDEQALDEVADPAFAGAADEAAALECPQVVVDVLAPLADTSSDPRRRGGLAELIEDAEAKRVGETLDVDAERLERNLFPVNFPFRTRGAA